MMRFLDILQPAQNKGFLTSHVPPCKAWTLVFPTPPLVCPRSHLDFSRESQTLTQLCRELCSPQPLTCNSFSKSLCLSQTHQWAQWNKRPTALLASSKDGQGKRSFLSQSPLSFEDIHCFKQHLRSPLCINAYVDGALLLHLLTKACDLLRGWDCIPSAKQSAKPRKGL